MTAKGKERAMMELLDLPGEILSQIASELPLPDLIAFLSLHSALHNLTRSHLTPLRAVISDILRAGPPYPLALAVLPSLTHLIGNDDGNLFVEVLVRAPAKWVLERLEIGRWRDHIWKEAFLRRFLPSWTRYKAEDDTWRAAFLRVIGRLEHRSVGCSHHESWTRFVTLRRNGSAAINRIYTRTFDPYEIFDELKHQANLADYDTQVRVLVHLQDVRVIALGVLSERPSYFVNPNAHLILHPPLLRHLSMAPARPNKPKVATVPPPSVPASAPPAAAIPVQADGHSVPARPPVSSSTSITHIAPETSRTPPSPTTTISSLSNWMTLRRRASNDSTAESSSRSIIRVRSREEGSERRWSFSRPRTNSTPGPLQVAAVPASPTNSASATPTQPAAPIFTPQGPSPFTPVTPSIPLMPPVLEDSETTNIPSTSPSPPPTRHRLPYPRLIHPTPAYTHALYPNFTPSEETTIPSRTGSSDVPILRVRDFRMDHKEAEDDAESTIWNSHEEYWGANGMQMTEWDPDTSRRRRWVGPMIIIAQLFPASRTEGVPAGSAPDFHIEGPHPELGPLGMYASLGWEDISSLFPWIEFRGSGMGDGMRNGLGFEPGQEW